ncbi:anaerobic magnesium-protoporphyrin IX monomethyl ester cyclase [Gemmobacter caeni]|uniref:Anaerobic magnesium-protoporphyrin IX monomethyl ester cyclase n=1 Tax=Gemmobacter caeni TaxID=589035 RepID=A0A2T6B1X0_9RHOB|nr:magnesium-protoporphyrin IX monomethyl ester anaerobic oxidative cyclase [Gemmobacter caeni]PTX50015.1 anaerobic magnesium-protoporphyrin IX monomethyl ester cyclase [Gemmobacter caeni]TWJ01910.1 anaerobic magnesium-protoporphyrin IX monomethyl ester cyclase [Gemmobacter caeni]
MRIALLNPPHRAIGSRVPKEQLPPLGHLAIGGPLIDAGHAVRLINADPGPMTDAEILSALMEKPPEAVLIGHAGSTSAHPVVARLAPLIRAALPEAHIVYGGVYPSYHWQEVLTDCPEIDVVVRGEGEVTAPRLIAALEAGADLATVPGIAFRRDGQPHATPPAPMLRDLDSARIGWELVDLSRHSYWGGKRAVILQFSRGCPHLCTYCGQRGFWTQWRHRDPVKFAAEIAWLVREHGVELVNLADENPTSSRKAWKAFLEALVATGVKVTLIGSTRADDIVRDADLLPLYKRAGCLRFLLGLEGTDEATLATVRKGGTRAKDREAIGLLRAHGMIGLCTFAVGFEEETDADYARLLRHLLVYDPDQIMSVYATPHRWTSFFGQSAHRRVVQTDLSLWDYKHQVLETPRVPAWRVFLWVKLIEAVVQLRPRALARIWLQKDPELRHAQRWYTAMGRGVWLREFRDAFRFRARPGPTVETFLGAGQLPENALDRRRDAA